MTSRLQNRSGFTIVELLIVIVVIGILATLVLTVFTGTDAKARDSQRITDLESVKKSLEVYYSNGNSRYPTSAQLFDTSAGGFVETELTGLDADALVDPDGNNYTYTVTPAGCDNVATDCTDFTMSVQLEVEDFDNDGNPDLYTVDGSYN